MVFFWRELGPSGVVPSRRIKKDEASKEVTELGLVQSSLM